MRALSGFTVRPATESGDKLTRFGPFSSQCRASNVKIRRGSWNEELFRILEGFPDLAHDDEVDACSGALEMLNPHMNSWGLYEYYRQEAATVTERSKPQPCSIRAPARFGGVVRGAEEESLNHGGSRAEICMHDRDNLSIPLGGDARGKLQGWIRTRPALRTRPPSRHCTTKP